MNHCHFGDCRELSRNEIVHLASSSLVLMPTRSSELSGEAVTILTRIAREETQNQEWFREVMKERMWKPR